MGIGAIGPAIGEGNAVGKALEGMARQPENTSNLRTNMLVGCAVAETTGIYSLVIALLLLFVSFTFFRLPVKPVLKSPGRSTTTLIPCCLTSNLNASQ